MVSRLVFVYISSTVIGDTFFLLNAWIDALFLIIARQNTVMLFKLFREIRDRGYSDGGGHFGYTAEVHVQHAGGVFHPLEMTVLHDGIAGVFFKLIDQC